jgi:hypothetical protein
MREMLGFGLISRFLKSFAERRNAWLAAQC